MDHSEKPLAEAMLSDEDVSRRFKKIFKREMTDAERREFFVTPPWHATPEDHA